MKTIAPQWSAIGGIFIAFLFFLHYLFQEEHRLKPIDELRVRLSSSVQIPDPGHITNTGDWYYLDHVSSGLSHYDSGKKKFLPLLSESWINQPDGSHRFTLRPNIRFHDGTLITTQDILWSLKRQLLLKTSTHFPLWEYVVGCEKIHTLDEECDGLRAISDREIEIRLKAPTESFFLQVASPETGIWAASDMDPKTLALKPTKFSGPYYLANTDDNSVLLKRNGYSLINQQFPNSPRSIRIKGISAAGIENALLKKDLDLAIRLHSGQSELDWGKHEIQTRSTTTSGIVHLFGLGKSNRAPIGQDFVKAAWKQNQDPALSTAESFLPFATNYGLHGSELLAELPPHTAKKLRFLCPEGFFKKSLLDQLQSAARNVGTEIEYSFAPFAQWFAMIDDPKANEKYDYLLCIYAASERYPAVQLRYLTGPFVSPPFDLKKAESPDLKPEQIELLRDYQKWLLRSRQTIPFYFTVTEFLYQNHIDLGEQPASDAEVELWRVQGK